MIGRSGGIVRFPVNYIDIREFYEDNNNLVFGYFPEDSNVYSIDDGEVIYVQYQSKYNNVVYIKHNNGLVSMYKRLDKANVKLGQKVLNGEKIGDIGSSLGSNKKFLLFGLFSENVNYLNGESDLDALDYLQLYPKQNVTNSTINIFGVKLTYHESCWKENKSNSNKVILVNQFNQKKEIKENNNLLPMFLISIIVLLLICFIVVKRKWKQKI